MQATTETEESIIVKTKGGICVGEGMGRAFWRD
mgnify:CR=1 FL=1